MTYPTATPEEAERWGLLDAIVDGTLTREQRYALAELVRAVSLNDHPANIRESYDRLMTERHRVTP